MKKQNKKPSRPERAADGLYHVQVYIGKYPNGKRFYRRFSGKDWKKLQSEIAIFKHEFSLGMHDDLITEAHEPEKPKEMCLLDAIDKYIETCRVMQAQDPNAYSVGTIAGYQSVRNSIGKNEHFKECANKPISQLTIADLQDALNKVSLPDEKGNSLSAKTVRNWYGLIKPAVETYGPDIRMNKIKIAKRPSRKAKVIKTAAIPQVLRIAREIDTDFFLYVLFTAILGTRPSESYALTWGDISAEPMISIADGIAQEYGCIFIDKAAVRDEFGKYRLKGTKTESGTRSLTRHWSFFKTLYEAKPRGKDNERIFDMNPNCLPYRWKKLMEKADLPEGMVMYDLRHYHASAMVACGAEARYIADDMGHADISITQKHYVEEVFERRQEINSRMFTHTQNVLDAYNMA